MRVRAFVAVVAACLAVVQCSVSCTGTSRHEGLLYPHMANNGDTEFLPRRDDEERPLPIQGKYKLYGTKYTDTLYVVDNGILAMTQSGIPNKYNPVNFGNTGTPFIAPAYSDVDLEFMLDGPEASHIWFRETKDRKLLSKFKTDMGGYFANCGGPTFKPHSLVIVTYQRVQSYCDHFDLSRRRSSGKSESDAAKSAAEKASAPINTFQLVYATNKRGKRSFAIFNYQCMSWDNCWSYTRAGFNDGGGKTAEIPNSGTSLFNTNDQNTNVGKSGRFMYRVDANAIRKPTCGSL